MIIAYFDKVGLIVRAVDENGISFADGKAYFSDGKTDYKVPVEHIDRIG